MLSFEDTLLLIPCQPVSAESQWSTIVRRLRQEVHTQSHSQEVDLQELVANKEVAE